MKLSQRWNEEGHLRAVVNDSLNGILDVEPSVEGKMYGRLFTDRESAEGVEGVDVVKHED